jgi:hypothetical protein
VARGKSKLKSEVESDPKENDSVYDFLYHDARRVGSFLGQFDPNGHLQGVQTGAETGRSTESKATMRMGAGVATLVSAGGDYEGKESQHWDKKGQRTFDPLWMNALAFLDYLTQSDLIVRDINKARIGQFILISGELRVKDFSLIKSIWSSPDVRKQLIENRQAQKAVQKAVGDADPKAGETPQGLTAVVLDIISNLPHGTQASIRATSQTEVWGSLKIDGMTSAASDLVLTHGSQVAGQWSLVGILDACPDPDEESKFEFPKVDEGDLEGLRKMTSGIADLARNVLGRPKGAFGVTPLLIFREISGS